MNKKRQFWNSLDSSERTRIAKQAGTTYDYLYQICAGQRDASPKMARRIAEAADGKLPLHVLRPDIWPTEDAA